MNSTGTNTSMLAVVESINDDYEYIQYNEKLRLIHSIKDDMYQMQSIIIACNSKKRVNDWFRNQSSQEILDEMGSTGIPADQIHDDRPNLPNDLKGVYIHRLLVNHVAMWASPRYSLHIMKLLDSHFEKQREQLTNKIEDLTPRAVPKDHKHSYRYMIWREELPKNKNFVILHLVRRNKHSWRQVSKIYQDEKKRWIYVDDLPIAMTPNEDIKRLARALFKGDDVRVGSTDIIINKSCLEEFHKAIEEYFKNMHL